METECWGLKQLPWMRDDRHFKLCSNYEREGARGIAVGWDAPTLNCSNYSILREWETFKYKIFRLERNGEE